MVDATLQQLAKEALAVEYAECASLVAQDRADSARTIPIFVCNAALPTQRCPLHVFEPRYRLMMRRAMQSGDRRFGMCAHTGGPAGWSDYGTVLYIKSLKLLPDGRSLVDTVGEKRFKVVNRGQRDGYMTAQVTWVDDSPGWEQEDGWVSSPAANAQSQAGAVVQPPPMPAAAPAVADIDAMTAQGAALLGSVRTWFGSRLGTAVGDVPFAEDASTFTWWALDKLPIGDNILVSMLSTTTPLDRLRAIASVLQVVMRAEAQRMGAGDSMVSSSDTGSDDESDDETTDGAASPVVVSGGSPAPGPL